jgi:aspartate oxidase
MISAASDADPKWGLKFFELQNLALTGAAVALSALARCESRGQHWRLDCPQSDPAYTGWVVVEQERGLKSKLVRGLPAKPEGGVSNAATR